MGGRDMRMNQSISFNMIALFVLGVGLHIYAAILAISYEEPEYSEEYIEARNEISERNWVPRVYHDTLRARGYIDIVLGRSPFSKERAAFSRQTADLDEVARAEVEPKFVGTTQRGGELAALIIWQVGGDVRVQLVGDETPLGELVSVTSTKLVFENALGQSNIDLY